MRLIRTFASALLGLAMLLVPMASSKAAVSIGISVNLPPPPLPVYEQPPIPGPGYLWTPGYWAWGPYGYYWVPGTWVLPPVVGVLWTPPWWGWAGGVYVFHAGYWGPTIGFYGGINYGFGYFGSGFDGGYWDHGHFFYNREVTNIRNVNITNVYNKTIVSNGTVNRVSFNGGAGGVTAQPTAQEQAALRQHHFAPTGAQLQHLNAARSNRDLLATTNNGQPKIMTTEHAGRFSSTGAVTPASTGPRFQGNTRTNATGMTSPKTLHSPGPNTSRGPNGGTPHVMSQTYHGPVHPQVQPHPPQPKGQPGGKNPQHQPG